MLPLLFLTLASQLCASPAPELYPLISETGMYHGDEWQGRPGDQWLGLYATKTGFELRKTLVTIEAVEDAILDGPDEKTGKKISAPDNNVLFLFQDIPNLNTGVTLTTFNGSHTMGLNASLNLRLSGPTQSMNSYWLSTSGTRDGIEGIEGYSFNLIQRDENGEEIAQTLIELDSAYEDGIPEVLWAGDLDRDGKLDLIADITDHYNVRHIVLYLSSYADDGELVGIAAELRATGC